MFLTLFVVLGSLVSVVAAEKYTISVCMTLSLDNALVCKKRIFDNMDGKVFIVKDKDERYYTYLDIFDNKNDAMSCEWWFKHKLVRKQKLSLIKNDLIKEKFIEYLELKQKKNIHLK